MNILRMLTRGTRQGPAGSRGNASQLATDLPSAGAHTNPQLFHDEIGSPHGHSSRKRKRTDGQDAAMDAHEDEDKPAAEEELSDAVELDFFASSDRTKTAETTSNSKQNSKDGEKASAGGIALELLGEDECKRMLRSHRLKLTLLPHKKTAEAESKKSKKSKNKSMSKDKKSKDADVAVEKAVLDPKEDKKPLFPQPLTAFSQLRNTYNISPRLADNLDRLLYRIPTEVQMGTLPLLLDPAVALSKTTLAGGIVGGIDFMAVAPTGSGKTLSFLVPAINSVLKSRSEAAEATTCRDLHTIVVAPTRELARQIAGEGKKLTAGTGVRVVAMCKGMRVQATGGDETETVDVVDSPKEEDSAEEEGEGDEDDDKDDNEKKGAPSKGTAPVTRTDILVTTPLMLLNYLTASKTRKTLPTVLMLVLDEADVLLDPLFREQTVSLWTACTHKQLQVTFWSATMGSNVEALVAEQLAAAAAQNTTRADRQLVRLVVGLKDTAVPNVAHRLVYTASEAGKLLAMRQLLHPATSVSVTGRAGAGADESETPLRPPFIVFAQTAERATALHDELKYDIPAAAGGADRLGVLHAALSDNARATVVRRFRAGEVWVLITTDVLARGIDFAGVNGVVNYDVPGSAAAYVHRAGRTGRAGRQGGLAVTLYTKEDIPIVKNVANVIAASERQAGKQPGGATPGLPQWLLDALPNVTKAERKRLRTRGVESRRAAGKDSRQDKDKKSGGRSRITSKSAWERRKENNLREAIASSKRRKLEAQQADEEEEWAGLD